MYHYIKEAKSLLSQYIYPHCNYDDNCVSLGLRVAKVIPCAKLQTHGNEQFAIYTDRQKIEF